MIEIAQESPLTDDGRALLAGSDAALRAVYSADECFTLDPEELMDDSITFLVARENGAALGCVALVDCGDYSEVKRLFVTPEARGKQLAKHLMDALESRAIALRHSAIKLETGDKLVAAVALYKRLGYAVCGPFGNYPEHPASLFMQKPLLPAVVA
ncbi:GNAT family N-acetyltransferase [Thalassobius sp. Cn5-15]|uniref:GNAT family N-acetyltransferase n=1 Tax=Thalassobius sp. Cn5-15 TaxID=2917763 RepID=UPI001EF234DF|nr:GNAT family N-acetyltransferase [Thalassobius sp. Cn5-15]MCG7493853.1 GNAT family N-acetyltransferase [Thalassobius sp. Cn5-15]